MIDTEKHEKMIVKTTLVLGTWETWGPFFFGKLVNLPH
jgi:hypothetical protein